MEKKHEELQRKYAEIQILNEQLKILQKNLYEIDGQIAELENSINNCRELKKIKKGSQLVVPISPGVFISAELKDNEEVLVNVGNNVVIKKKINEAEKFISKRIESIKDYRNLVVDKIDKVNNYASMLERDIKEIIEERGK